MLKCQNCGNKARGTVSAICKKCGYIMLPFAEKKYKKIDEEEIKENGDR